MDEELKELKNKKVDGKELDIDSIIAETPMFDNNIFNEFNEYRKQIERTIQVRAR